MPSSASSRNGLSGRPWPPEEEQPDEIMSHCWMHPPENAAWSATTNDRRLEGAVAQELPLRALSRTQHFVFGPADTDRRLSEGPAPRLPKEAASSWDRHQRFLRRRRTENGRRAFYEST